MTELTTIQSWPREQLESAFTQREEQLEKCQMQRDALLARPTENDDEIPARPNGETHRPRDEALRTAKEGVGNDFLPI